MDPALAPLEDFMLKLHGVSHPLEMDISRSMPMSFTLMTPHTAWVEMGSARDDQGQRKPLVFSLETQPEETMMAAAERLKVRCFVSPDNKETCRIIKSAMPDPSVWPKNPTTNEPMPPDLSRVSIYNIVTRHLLAALPPGTQCALRAGFVHSGLDQLYGLSAQNEAQRQGGLLVGAYTCVERTPAEGVDVNCVAMPISKHYANAQFTSTMALVTEENLLNGIVTVPPDVCRACKFPEFCDIPQPHEQLIERVTMERNMTREEFLISWNEKMTALRKSAKPVSHYMAIPLVHVLAWELRDPIYAQARLDRSCQVQAYRFHPPEGNQMGLNPHVPIVLYYLINNVTFDEMVAEFRQRWLNKVDVRPLDSLYWDFLPLIDKEKIPAGAKQATGIVEARSLITYMVPPILTPEQRKNIFPALCPDFPPCTEWTPQ